MSGVTLPTPSPLSFSAASTAPPIRTLNLFLRFLSLVFSFAAALSLILLSSSNAKLNRYPQLLYLFAANILNVIYGAYQLSKSICDIAHRGIFVSDMVSDYISFILDQVVLVGLAQNIYGVLFKIGTRNLTMQIFHLVTATLMSGYLIVSASSVAVAVVQQRYNGNSFWKATIVSVCMSFASFLVIAATALLSGYKLCKRIMW